MNLDGRTMFVSSTSAQGVVGTRTLLHFMQIESRVMASYRGGPIQRGYLVGEVKGSMLTFRYTQVECSGEIHAGSSICDLETLPDGRARIVEHFTWSTREGSGENIFEDLLTWREDS